MSGIICANFGCREFNGQLCQSAWHGNCYVQGELDKFPILTLADLEDSIIDDRAMIDDDPKRFKTARNGDHLMVPFQCDTCHFVNIQRRFPTDGNAQDQLLLLALRRVNLDSCWARERSTVQANQGEGARYLKQVQMMGVSTDLIPQRGPYRVADDWGVHVACAMVLRSLDVGRNSTHIQYDTVRKLRSFFSNLSHSSLNGTGYNFVSNEGTSARVSHSVTNGIWFQRFMEGMHRRMGDVWLPNRALSQYELTSCFQILDSKWEAAHEGIEDKFESKRTATTACILVAGYFASLRGEEIAKVDLGAMNKYWDEAMNHPKHKHVPLMMSGTFKKETGIKYFCQPLAMHTTGGRDLSVWFIRLMKIRRSEGVTTGPMFLGYKDRRISIAEMDVLFHAVLMHVQLKYSSVLAETVDIKVEYSTFRSLRRGSTSEAQNVEIPKEVIEANNRWRKQARSKGMKPSMSMMEHYSDARVAVPALTKFSKLLPG